MTAKQTIVSLLLLTSLRAETVTDICELNYYTLTGSNYFNDHYENKTVLVSYQKGKLQGETISVYYNGYSTIYRKKSFGKYVNKNLSYQPTSYNGSRLRGMELRERARNGDQRIEQYNCYAKET